jgi:hypothetical protein
VNEVVNAGHRPKLDRAWPSAFCNLITRCWDSDQFRRPSFQVRDLTLATLFRLGFDKISSQQEIVEDLDHLLAGGGMLSR